MSGLTLVVQGGFESSDVPSNEWFYNTEWRDVYIGKIITNTFEKIKFNDNEVVDLYLCSKKEARNILT